MKTIYLLLVISFFVSCSSDDETTQSDPQVDTITCTNGDLIYNGDITLNNQAEVNAFGALCYGTINGKLSIGSSFNDIVDLTPLFEINKVGGLYIGGTSLTSLEGINLNNQSSLELFEIYENLNLLTVGNINIPTSIETFSLFNNNTLINFSGFNDVEYIGELLIQHNDGLINFEGLDSLTSCSLIFMYGANQIVDFEGLESLTSIMGEESEIGLDLKYNLSLQSLNGLENLLFSDRLVIEANSSLNDYCALTNLLNNGNGEALMVNWGPGPPQTNNLYNPTLLDMQNGNCSQ